MTFRLLFSDPAGLVAYAPHAGALCCEARFAPDTAGFAGFSAYLDRHRKQVFHLLVSLAEESIVADCIPRLRGREREQLIARRAERHCPQPAMYCAVPARTDKRDRQNECLLFSALPENTRLRAWLEILKTREIALSGAYSPTQLSTALLARLGVSPVGHKLLLSRIGSGLRVSHLHHGQTVFTRQIPLETTPTPANTFVSEALTLRQYLLAQHKIEHDAPLPTLVLCHPETVTPILELARSANGLLFQTFTVESSLSFPESIGEQSEILFLKLLAQRRPKQQFAPASHCTRFREIALRRTALGIGASLCIAGTAYAAGNFLEIRDMEDEIRQQEAATALLQQHEQKLNEHLRELAVSPEKLPGMLGQYAELVLQKENLATLLRQLSGTLEGFDPIELDTLEWRAAPPFSGEGGKEHSIRLSGRINASPEDNPESAADLLKRFSAQVSHDGNCRAEPPRLQTLPAEDGTTPTSHPDNHTDSHAFSLALVCKK